MQTDSTSPSAADTIRQQCDTRLLTAGRVVQIGLGGIGQFLVRPLAVFLNSIAGEERVRLVLCDGDSYAPENAYRMEVPELANKAVAVGKDLLARHANSALVVRWVAEYVTAADVEQLVQPHDCVLLCVDNHATRKLVSDRCGQLDDVTLISGGNDGIQGDERGTYGNVQIYLRRAGRNVTAPLTLFHPDIAQPQDKSPDELDCVELAASGAPQLLWTNLSIAAAMGAALMRLVSVCDRAMYDESCLDILEAQWTALHLSQDDESSHGHDAGADGQ
jgi:hypothetical protein